MAGSKPTAVHFSLVFFVMLTLIFMLLFYLGVQEQTATAAKLKVKEDEAASARTTIDNNLNDINALKTLLGYEGLEQVGAGGNDENSVVATAKKDLVTYGRDQVQPSPTSPVVVKTVQSMATALKATQEQSQQRNTSVQDVSARLQAEKTAMTNLIEQLRTTQETSEQQLQKLVTDQTEKIAEKDREIQKTRQELAAERVAREQISDELNRVRRSLSDEIALLEKAIETLRIDLNALENLSFDKPDGAIVRVDNVTRRVWINIGSKDYLRPQVTFSVYTQNNRGVGRGSEDIKAKVEVTKITNRNLAECRIIQEDFDRPIQAGDPVYSPLFEPGATEFFSFMGILDMDGDGKSDRELLHDIITNAGADVEIEIDDQGNRSPEGRKMSVKTKFLVVGDIPDPSKIPGTDERQEEIQKMFDEKIALERAALRQGIRIITFRDFLNYIGYENKERLFVAGGDRKYNLKAGSRSTGTDEVLGANRLSSGQTSQRFRSDRGNRGAATSTGQTSKKFGN